MLAAFFAALTFVLAAVSLQAVQPAEVALRPTTLRVGSGVPCMIDIVSSQGEIMSSWFGRGNSRCQIGWLREPLLLLFYANTPDGEAIVGGDPLTGATYEVLNLTGVDGILFRVRVAESLC